MQYLQHAQRVDSKWQKRMLKKVTIRNFKSIKDAEIDLQNINILIGANGAGKSNFIAFFDMVGALLNGDFAGFVQRQGGYEHLSYNGNETDQIIEGTLDFDDADTFHFNVNPTDNKFLIRDADYNYNSQWLKDYDASSKNTSECCQQSEYIKNCTRYFTAYHFNDSRSLSKMCSGCSVSDNEVLRRDGSNLAACLFRLQQERQRDFLYLESVIHSVVPDFKQFKFVENASDERTVSLKWEQTGTDTCFNGAYLSDGTLRFIALTTLLLQPIENATIIIDEPELGLHPNAINKLAAMVQRAALKNQVIVATQSVSLINRFQSEDIIFTDKGNSTTLKRVANDDIKGWMADYSLGEIWEKGIIGVQS